MENFVYWLANGSPLWAAYCAFMSGHLIALDKHTGMRTVGVRETRRRIFAKTVLKFTGPEATMAYQDEHMCAGLTVGIGGAFHKVQAIWDKNSTREDW